MPQTARSIYDEYLLMADGEYDVALNLACKEIARLGPLVSAGFAKASPMKSPPPAKLHPVPVDGGDEWIETGREVGE